MFETLLSNTRMKEELTRAIRDGRTMQAYLFCGAAGSGKKTAAYLLAAELVGKNSGKVLRHTHPDVITPQPLDKKKSISVEQIRDMRADAFISPSEGTRKIYVVDLNLVNEAGQNALLTVLEQPPSYAVFILLCDSRGSVLPTVLSRCAVYDMEYVTPEQGAQYLQGRTNVTYESAERAMRAAQGNVGAAIALLTDGGFENGIAVCEKIVCAAAGGDEYGAAKEISGISKERAQELMSALAMYLRDIAVYRETKSGDLLVFRDSVLKNATLFDKIDINTLYDSIADCEKAILLINGNVNHTLAASNAVIRLCGGKKLDRHSWNQI